tara:strand:- start:31929 stop:32609 length:681 start_codon:yes stop_codon:yes gene_type:complete
MLFKDIWLSKVSNINCFNIKFPFLRRDKLNIKKNILISCKILKINYLQKKNNLKFRFVGQNIIFSKDIDFKKKKFQNKLSLNVSKKKDKKKVINICIKNLKSSRFDLDKRIPRAIIKKIRFSWISSYFLKRRNKLAYSVVYQKKIVGLLCIIKKKKNLIIDLIAISKNYNGKGFGSYIIDDLQSKFPKYKKIIVGTYRQNRQAVMFYKKCGFEIIKIYNVFHYYEK